MEKGVKRWLVDTSKRNPSPNDFSLALLYVLPHERRTMSRAEFDKDSTARVYLPNVAFATPIMDLFGTAVAVVAVVVEFDKKLVSEKRF